jgi:hypothetical protein
MRKRSGLRLTLEQQEDLVLHLANEQVVTVEEVNARVSLLQHSGCSDKMVVDHLNHLLTDRGLKKPPHKARQRLSHHIGVLNSPKSLRQDK